MNIEQNWMQLYLEGIELERSLDKKNWYPIEVEEPRAGDGFYYRKVSKDVKTHGAHYYADYVQDSSTD